MSGMHNSKNIDALNGSGSVSAADPVTGLATLTATDTYYFPIPVASDGQASIQIVTGALIAGTFTIEACNAPTRRGEVGPVDVSDYDETAGNWVQINTASAGYAQGVGTGWTINTLSLGKTAGAAGAIINLVSLNTRRLRVAAAITTTGTVRVVAHVKE